MKTPIGDIKIRNSYDEMVVKEVVIERSYERWGGIKLEGNVLDCGAHIGSFSKLAICNGCTVTAVEPSPENFLVLQENVPEAKLFYRAITNLPEVHMYIDNERSELNKIADSGVLVKGITLDELIDKPIDVLKMDIEGAEYEALYSCKKLHLVKQITMEYHDGAKALGELLLYLSNKGFEFGWIGGQGFGHLQMKR